MLFIEILPKATCSLQTCYVAIIRAVKVSDFTLTQLLL